MKTSKTKASELLPGNVIPPPAHERKWLWRDGTRRMLTVLEVREGHADKNGLWLYVTASFSSPYDEEKPSRMVLNLRPNTVVNVQ